MKNIKKTLLLSLCLFWLGCSSSSNTSGPVEFAVNDLTGIYRTSGDLSNIDSVTSVQIKNGRSETDLTAEILRNGLSDEELTFFNNLGEVQWADDQFGRVLFLEDFKEGLVAKNRLEDDLSIVDVCGNEESLDSRTLDFRYCLNLTRLDGSLIAEGNLILEVYEFGLLVHTISTPFELFTKDRWFVEYFGNWTGQIRQASGSLFDLRSGAGGDRLDITFQAISETNFILRPIDENHSVNLNGERFSLLPETRDMVELEGSANPYINFVYISDLDGSRRISFNNFIHSEGHIEGEILFHRSGLTSVILGYYELNQQN